MQSGRPTEPSSPADETLDLALLTGIVFFTAAGGFLIWSGFDSLLAITGIVVGSLVSLLVVIPHVTALWLDRDVDVLLGIADGQYPE